MEPKKPELYLNCHRCHQKKLIELSCKKCTLNFCKRHLTKIFNLEPNAAGVWECPRCEFRICKCWQCDLYYASHPIEVEEDEVDAEEVVVEESAGQVKEEAPIIHSAGSSSSSSSSSDKGGKSVSLVVDNQYKAGVNKLADLVGVTLGLKGCNVVLERKYGLPKIVNDAVTVAKEVELEDPVENIGAKLVRQAASKTNDMVGDGTTTSVVLAQGLITEAFKVVAAGANPIQITRGIERTTKALVAELKRMSKDVEQSIYSYLFSITCPKSDIRLRL